MQSAESPRDLVARLNRDVAPERHVAYEATHAFGGDALNRYRLANGLAVLLLVDTSAPVASYFTWYRVGSRHEKPGKTGLAHFFEHLMFNETEGLKAGEFNRRLEEHGAESNAATWVDWTYYYESLPSESIGLAVELEAERMGRLVLREPQVKSEREVVSNERRYRVEDDVEGFANELLYKTAFTKHPYHWPTIGWMQDIEAYTPEDCQAFYRTYYAPNNATVIVVGNVVESDMLTKIRDAYSAIPASELPIEDTYPEPAQLEERVIDIDKPTASEKLYIGYRGPALGDVDHVHLTVLSEVLFGGRASRLHRALVIERELASDLRGWASTFRDPGLYEVFVTAREGESVEEIQSIVDVELARVQDGVVTEDELVRAKARLELSMLQSLETMSGKAEQIGFYDTVVGDPCAAFHRLEAYRRTTASDLRRVARRYLAKEARTIVRVFPEDPHDESQEATESEESAS